MMLGTDGQWTLVLMLDPTKTRDGRWSYEKSILSTDDAATIDILYNQNTN